MESCSVWPLGLAVCTWCNSLETRRVVTSAGHSFVLLSSISGRAYTAVCLTSHLLKDTGIISSPGL